MWFKNARIYTLDKDASAALFKDPQALEEQLERTAFRPCMAQELSTMGFAPLTGPGSAFHFSHAGSFYLKLTEETKLLPAAVVRTELEERIRQAEEKLGRQVHKNEQETLRTALIGELLEKAFATRRDTLVWLNPALGLCAVGASSAKRAEKVLALLREALGSFPAKVLQPRCVAEDKLTAWLSQQDLPASLTLGTDTTLKSPADEGGTIRASREDLASEEIAVHVKAGKLATEVQLIYAQEAVFVLSSELVLKRVKLLDQYLERSLPEHSEDEAADLQALLIVQGDLLSRLCTDLLEFFDCER
ncbi:MAG: recombination-associated protein RdgC [Succinivibrio sp.]|nr:recombination-associated protein RdgC [Succinivibrio sp.]